MDASAALLGDASSRFFVQSLQTYHYCLLSMNEWTTQTFDNIDTFWNKLCMVNLPRFESSKKEIKSELIIEFLNDTTLKFK